ncbi:BREX-5 system adenine-specific DNA-methyltransferase PglX [Halomicroarcula sp. S1AR25-4]|uniref:BREX-5 system adenine-specific DNA-methyltransferase PglX n=1 Tax=Haloarcula sp. S1AR25-4 TaxID=2950538 RepID=UPI002874BDE9|nr:BREX-5 system adenine-specific DNA-methyltransferase PglX [Halomicroarcula sp. S1AR25-4]MDS0279652.1 BREX-5 system adenine-specific DNA-methyltransferase PglX [Halomicroarcula sp. S1AR25-4]
MADTISSQRKAQLDKEEREHLEAVVTEMRERVEDNVRFQLAQKGLDDGPAAGDVSNEDIASLVEAIELEAVDGNDWADGYEQYVTGVGYTIVNRLAALRCMEVRDFVDEEVTVFKENGLTPAAETLVHEEFLLEDEAILEAYHRECDALAEEIELLFDRSSAYSLVDPDDDTFEELCDMLDSVPDEVWRADDVLGWVYEYYNVKLLDDLRRKGDREGLDPEDVPAANQFYTPHWVVRMLTDNSLGKLYLEHTGELQDVVDTQERLSPDERKNRPLSPDESPDIADFCTYLVPSEEEGEPTDFDHPEELRVIDPACGSGHFLLYAFDVLERIWRAETDLSEEEIPRKILQHNLYGVDLDMRACQLAAFNLYLKGRTRAEADGADGFDMPEVGIVCADATVADVEGVEAVFDEVAGDDPKVEDALRRILDAFEEVNGLGSLLDVRGTLGDLFEDDSETGGTQLTLGDDPRESHTLGQVLHSLREAVGQHRDEDSLLAQDLRSFVRLLDILAQDYDVALMNPPYGSRKRMPDTVQKYVENRYTYFPDYYISFVEKCNGIVREGARIGVLMPRSFMFKKSFEAFRKDFVERAGSFDFLAEFGLGILDNATVRTVGTVLRSGTTTDGSTGTFYRLHDLEPKSKEVTFSSILSNDSIDGVQRRYRVPMSDFRRIPGYPISYYVPPEIRRLHDTDVKLDAEVAKIAGDSIANIATGLQTGNNDRFLRQHWEVPDDASYKPYAKGGSDAWIAPAVPKMVHWSDDAREIQRIDSARFQNSDYYGKEGLTWTYIKDTGRRFGYLPAGNRFDVAGSMVFPTAVPPLELMVVLNSELYHMVMLSLTPERQWNQGDVGRLPWIKRIRNETLEQIGINQYNTAIKQQYDDPTSPYYVGPSLLLLTSNEGFFYQSHQFTDQQTPASEAEGGIAEGDSFKTCSQAVIARRKSHAEQLEEYADQLDDHIYSALDFGESTREAVQREITLRGTQAKAGDVAETRFDIEREIKDLVHHFAMEAAREESDGIIPIHSTEADMFDRIIERFEDAYGEYAGDRLVEVDEILGAKSATEEAYPNLRAFIENDLFDYHVDRMQNTPILWKLTTERLVADSMGEGFACFVDYHSLDSGLLDRLANQYLEPRKAELRERRSAANRRRSDESLSTSEQAEAAEQYERCASGLNQISVFEDVLQELGSTDERDFEDEDRQLVEELAPKVATFREETRERVDTLAKLRERNGEEWFQDTFSDNFWNAVDEWREEWIDALGELERACEEYAKPADESVEAHLADLFDYFNWRLKGSDHYSSTGILFMTYYFEREGADRLDEDGEPFDTLTDDERLLASLATGLDDPSVVDEGFLEAMADDAGVEDVDDLPPLAEFKALAAEIDDRCQTIDKRIPSEWADRALSEITTEGYQPNHKHGVEINAGPLADAEIVPKVVDEQVI